MFPCPDMGHALPDTEAEGLSCALHPSNDFTADTFCLIPLWRPPYPCRRRRRPLARV